MTPWALHFLEILQDGEPHRELYRGRDRKWYITYGAGEVPPSVVEELKASGKLRSVYSNCPSDSYHIGQTLNVIATQVARKKAGNRSIKIYI